MTAPIIDATGAAIPTGELEAWAAQWYGDPRLEAYAHLSDTDPVVTIADARMMRRQRWAGTGQLWERLREIEP